MIRCGYCGRKVANRYGLTQHTAARHPGQQPKRKEMRKPVERMSNEEAFAPDWDGECEVCGQGPTVTATGLCGPCTFGEAATAGGNW